MTGHGTLPYLYGNVGDIVVSPVLMSCFSAPQYSSKVLDQLGLTPGASPSLETLMLLTVHYLAQLGKASVIHTIRILGLMDLLASSSHVIYTPN